MGEAKTLDDFRRDLGLAEKTVKTLKAIVANWEEVERMNGSHPSRSPRRVVLRSSVTPIQRSFDESEVLPPAPMKGDGNTIRAAVEDLVFNQPGIASPDAVRALVGRVALGSKDPKKLISTRIGQFVKAGKIRREGNRLFPPEVEF